MTLSTSAPGLKPYMDLLRRRRRVALWSGVATLVISGAFALGLPELYRATATLLVQGAVPEAFVQPSVPGEVDTRLQVLKQEALSRGRLTALIERFQLYGIRPGAHVPEDALRQLEKDIVTDVTSETTRNGQSTAVSFIVSYAASDPRTAADVTNALAAFYVQHNEQTRVQQASRATETIAAQLEQTRAELEAQAARIRTYTSRNMGALPQQTDANLSAINRLDSQFQRNADELLRRIERRQQLQNEIASIDTRIPAADENTPASRLLRKKAELNEVLMKFSDSHPDVRAARAELVSLERAAAASGGRGSAPAPTPRTATNRALQETEAQIAQLPREQQTLRAEIDRYQRRVERAPANEPAFDGLLREHQATRDRLDELQQRHDEAMLAERAESGAIQELRLLDAAVPPVAPSGPARGMLLGLSLVLALVNGIGAAVIADWSDTSFHTVDDLRAFTRVPVLASIPELATRRVGARTRDLALACARLVALGALALGAFQLAHHGDRVVRVLSRVS